MERLSSACAVVHAAHSLPAHSLDCSDKQPGEPLAPHQDSASERCGVSSHRQLRSHFTHGEACSGCPTEHWLVDPLAAAKICW
mmetsp:Transcript_67091/g.149693  ORF Transcript_67091/g.149693 Transcript_67091/m.149693 type:complete len:83 (+) Transcript_67091:483-731(+)